MAARQQPYPLGPGELLDEFENHANHWSTTPTALVSASTRIVDTMSRAFNMYDEEGEHPADIWIAFIGVPVDTNEPPVRSHRARLLAEQIGLPDPVLFHYGTVFEWEIPKAYVMHRVSLQTLLDRKTWLTNGPTTTSTGGLQVFLAEGLLAGDARPDAVGIELGCLAQAFGARAPLEWIAHQLFNDCVKTSFTNFIS